MRKSYAASKSCWKGATPMTDARHRRSLCLCEPVNRLWYKSFKRGRYADAVRYIDNLLAQPG